ncbi:hypothetical protein ONZ45_g5377 [Pleurotus djamor]|nr:hypothetical protein ONZ45_g5377 [Pleurotus djamor]
MFSVLALVSFILAGSRATPISPANTFLTRATQCNTGDLPTSCGNTTAVEDLCCFEHPYGLILQTQFWDGETSNGPSDSWTVHGLWSDRCDGTYDEFCDPSRDYDDLSGILKKHGADDTLDFMRKASLVNTWTLTLNINASQPYFQAAVKAFKDLPTYELLSAAGIKPTADGEFSLDALLAALKKGPGVTPRLDCQDGKLKEVGWYFHLKGSIAGGEYIAIDAPDGKGSCPKEGIKYLPKKTSGKDSKSNQHSS